MAYRDVILAHSSLVSYWRLGESSGTSAADSKGANTGTYQTGCTLGAAGLLAGDSDTAVALSGTEAVSTGGYVSVPSATNLQLTGQWTLEAWVKTTITGRQQAILTKSATDDYYLWLYNGLQPAVGVRNAANTTWVEAAGAAGDVPSGQPAHIVAVKDATSLRLYINGVLKANVATTDAGHASAGPLNLASENGGAPSTTLGGTLDEVAVYNAALTAAQVLDHYQAGTQTGPYAVAVKPLPLRERAPLRLAYQIETPSGKRYRWALDEPRPENVPSKGTGSSTMPGGFERESVVLPRRPDVDYADLSELSTITVYGPGGEVAGQGRLETSPRTSGDQMSVTPGAVGWQAALDDRKDAREIYVDRDMSRFAGEGSTSWKLAIAQSTPRYNPGFGSSSVDPDDSGTPTLMQQITHLEGSPTTKRAIVQTWYDAGGIPLAKIYYDETSFDGTAAGAQLASGSWVIHAGLSADDIGNAVDLSADLSGSAHAAYFSATATNRTYALVQLFNTSSFAGDGDWRALWRKLAAYGQHGLTLYGTDPGGVLASDVAPHAISTWAPELTYRTSGDPTITPSTFVVPHLTFLDFTTAGDIITQANRFELYDWAVWEDRTFFYHPRGARGRKWRARAARTGLSETGPQIDRIWNSVVVQFQDVTGRSRTVGPVGSGANTEDASLTDSDPLNPCNQAGIQRRALVSMGISTAAGAIQIGARFLEEQALLNTSGQATLTGHVEDEHGVLWPYWMVRAGDTITFVDASNTNPRRIVSAERDDEAKTCQITLDSPPDSLQAVLERLSVVLVPLGLGA